MQLSEDQRFSKTKMHTLCDTFSWKAGFRPSKRWLSV